MTSVPAPPRRLSIEEMRALSSRLDSRNVVTAYTPRGVSLVAANRVPEGCSRNLGATPSQGPPQGAQETSSFQGEEEEIRELLGAMRRAIRPIYRDRLKTKTRRSRLEMPQVPSWVEYRARRGRQTRGAYARVRRYLSRLSFRVLNDRHKLGCDRPPLERLEEALARYVERHMSKFIYLDWSPETTLRGYGRFAYFEPHRVERLAHSVAVAVLRDWSPDWIQAQIEAGAIGGSRPKPRPRAWEDPGLLARLRDLDGTHQEAATALGVPKATIRRARDRLRELESL